MKKLFTIGVCALSMLLILTGCGSKTKKVEMSVDEVLDTVYSDFKQDELPQLGRIEITEENIEYYTGLTKLDYKEAKVSEPLMGSIAHSVVAIKVNDGVDIEKTKKEIKEKVNPAKWVCVNAENVIVLSKGDVIVLIMTDENDNGAAKKMQENFNKVK